jgi:hypothetical protein
MRHVVKFLGRRVLGNQYVHAGLHAGYFLMIFVEHHGVMAWLGGALLITTVFSPFTGEE